MLKTISISGALFAAVLLGAPVSWAGVLDGKTFSGQIGEKGKGGSSGEQPDDFVFADGKFKSSLCSSFGYDAGDYTAVPAENGASFTAETKSKNGGKMNWSGVVRGLDIEGNAMTVENGKSSRSWFKGRLKNG